MSAAPDWSRPAPAALRDERVLVRPVTEADREPLHAQAMDASIWRWFVSLVETDEDYHRLFDTMLADHAAGTRAVFVVVDRRTDEVAGSMSFGNMSPRDQRLEIGWSWLGVRFQGTGLNRHAKLVLLDHAFDVLGAERVEFKTDFFNVAARRGLANIGAVEEGTFRSFNPMPGGRRRDAVYYSIIHPEWPATRARLTAAADAVGPAGVAAR